MIVCWKRTFVIYYCGHSFGNGAMISAYRKFEENSEQDY